MMSFHLTRRAKADLEEISDYLADHSAQAATRVINALHRTFAFLGEHPQAGTLREDLRPK
jgi:plasmid stabilization system protein ParE